MPRRGPRFAEPDPLKLLVQSVLSDNLIKKQYRVDWSRGNAARRLPRFEGHCYAASEAYWFLRGGERSSLQCKQLTLEDDDGRAWSHRWLETPDGEIIDLTIAKGEERKMKSYPYDEGRNLGFIKSKGAVSVRAQEIVDRVERARKLRLR
jgi:hypothetical protein